ncbi:hypothetical protein V8C86DRAFT_2573514 [Haematococcus lacustris]
MLCKRCCGGALRPQATSARNVVLPTKAPNLWSRSTLNAGRATSAIARASSDTQAPIDSPSSTPDLVPDTDFSIAKISYGSSILTPLGVGLLVYGFGAFFQLLPGGDVSSLMLIYGFPISVLGFALSYAQLAPVPCKTTRAAFELRSSQMTDIQKQIREDVTRYRYGDEQHLEEALDKIFRFGKSGGLARKQSPLLVGVREEVMEGAYTLVLEFKASLDMEKWTEKQPKFQSFFGPGVEAIMIETAQGVDVALKCDGSGLGREGKVQKDALPPLMPGLKARQQD